MEPVLHGHVGALFELTSDAVVIVEREQVVAWNPSAERLFGTTAPHALAGAPTPLDPFLPELLALPPQGAPVRATIAPHLVVEVVRRPVDGRDVLLLRDVTEVLRRAEGLARLAALSRTLLGQTQTVAAATRAVIGEAKVLTGAAYAALLLLREGSRSESSHFVYDAPRHLFPARMPRVVGLLALPLATAQPVRLEDVRGHPAGVGLPGVHPPMGPLLAVPLLAGDELLGELAVASPPGDRCFTALDELLLVDLAAHASVAVRRAQHQEQEQEQSLRRQAVVDAARHDIRTPLGAGRGYASLLATRRDRMSEQQVQTALESVLTAFDRIEGFTARLLVDDRLSSAGVEPQWAVVDVGHVLEQVRRDAVVTTGRHDAVLVQGDPGAPRLLAADPEMLREVVDNLVGNALKHGGDAAPVTVTVRREGAQVRLDVRDEGPGITEDEQAALFERWSRTSASRAAMVPGFGLGLSIVKRLVLAHGGLLGVSSRPGEGATFWVTFPETVPGPVEPGD